MTATYAPTGGKQKSDATFTGNVTSRAVVCTAVIASGKVTAADVAASGMMAAADVMLSGADCAEEFDLGQPEAIEPGSVVVFDEDDGANSDGDDDIAVENDEPSYGLTW